MTFTDEVRDTGRKRSYRLLLVDEVLRNMVGGVIHRAIRRATKSANYTVTEDGGAETTSSSGVNERHQDILCNAYVPVETLFEEVSLRINKISMVHALSMLQEPLLHIVCIP